MVGRRSQFTQAQDEHIESCMKAFEDKVHELDPELKGTNSALLTKWKQETAETIKCSPLFEEKLLCEGDVTLTTWTGVRSYLCVSDYIPTLTVETIFQRIIRKFTNHFSNMKRKSQTSQPSASGDQFFIKVFSHVTGRQLYEQEHSKEINAEATRRRMDSNADGSHAGFYQAVLKQMWDDEEEKEEYEKRAKKATNNISQHVMSLIFAHLIPHSVASSETNRNS